MIAGFCNNFVFRCPNCYKIHGGVTLGGMERSCQACEHRQSCQIGIHEEGFLTDKGILIIYKPCETCLNNLF